MDLVMLAHNAQKLATHILKVIHEDAAQTWHTVTHTHPFNGPLSGNTRVSWYQKGKTSLDFTEASDIEWQWHQLGHMQDCISLYTDNHASTPPLSFLQAGCPSCRPTNSVKALKAPAQTWHCSIYSNWPTRGCTVTGARSVVYRCLVWSCNVGDVWIPGTAADAVASQTCSCI